MPEKFKFKPGDRVRSLDADLTLCPGLIRGKVYTVATSFYTSNSLYPYVYLKETGFIMGWSESRFELYENGLEKAVKYAKKF